MEGYVRSMLGGREGFLKPGTLRGLSRWHGKEEVHNAQKSLECLAREARTVGLPSIFALHFRSPILEDGRATFAASPGARDLIRTFLENRCGVRSDNGLIKRLVKGEQFSWALHKDLLTIYRRLYTRPLSFNDRIFQVVVKNRAPTPSVWTVLFHFDAEDGGPLLQEESRENGGMETQTEFRIRLTTDLINSLNRSKEGDLRFHVLQELANLRDIPESKRHGRFTRPPRKLRRDLAEAVEMTWHRILARDSSFDEWNSFLRSMDFLESSQEEGWAPDARAALLNALRFVQGVTLYEILAPEGLSTTVVPELGEKPDSLGAWTIGAGNSGPGVDQLLNCLLPSATPLLSRLFESAVSEIPPNHQQRKKQPDPTPQTLSQYLGDEDLATELRNDQSLTAKAEDVFVSVMKLCLRLCQEKHEQIPLRFRFFLGSSVDLARFREVHVFESPSKREKRRNEQEEFKEWDEGKRARCLKAHYSHLQDPGIGLFFEWERRINFRFVEIVDEHPGLLLPGRVESDLETSRSASAKRLTGEVEGLVVADAGDGRVQLYHGGEVVLAWPKDGSNTWWSPGQVKSWSSEGALEQLLMEASQQQGRQLDPPHAALLADALLWVSEASGLGCSLVLTAGKDDEKDLLMRHQVPLNLKKFGWVDRVPLADSDPRDICNLLIQDGATILNLHTHTLTNQVQLVPFDRNNLRAFDPFSREDVEDRWTYGTRHASACDITEAVPQIIVLTVSADGPISVFQKGKKISKFEELQWS